MSESIGAGRYQLLGLLGSGGMASVHRAYDSRLDVERAIKVLAPRLAGNPAQRERFVNEARTMAKLHHPNVVTVHDVDVDDGRAYLVMEILPGGSLVDRVTAGGPLAPRLAVDVVAGLLEGLEVAHDAGVVHRDIKPHNVLLDAKGVPKLTDFGIARVTTADRSMTRTGAVMGTLAYMAPEQRLSSKDVDARADIYAVGCTLYALISGREPFDLHATELHDQTFAGIEPLLADVIKRATRARPDDRFGTAAQMREALVGLRPRLPEAPPGADRLVTSLGASSSGEVVRAAHGLAPTPASEIGTGSGSTGPGAATAGATFAFDPGPGDPADSSTTAAGTLSDDGGTLPDKAAPPAVRSKPASGRAGFVLAMVLVLVLGGLAVAGAFAVVGAGGVGAVFFARQSQRQAMQAELRRAEAEQQMQKERQERQAAEAASEAARAEAARAEAERREVEARRERQNASQPGLTPPPEPQDTGLNALSEEDLRAIEEFAEIVNGPALDGPFGQLLNTPVTHLYDLTLETRPAGIQVCADPLANRQCISTPGTLSLRPGLHTLVIEHPRLGKVRKVVTIRDSDISRCFVLPGGRPCD